MTQIPELNFPLWESIKGEIPRHGSYWHIKCTLSTLCLDKRSLFSFNVVATVNKFEQAANTKEENFV